MPVFLGSIPGEIIKPYVSFFLLMLGIYVIYRFLFKFSPSKQLSQKKLERKFYIPLGFIAGFFDATGGGGWGPIATPVLLTSNKMEPRKVIGTVDTSEFAIAISSTLGFLLTLGWTHINIQWVIALMIGGIIAAPVAAWLVKIIPTHLLGTLVGGLIILTNIRTLLGALDVSHTISLITYLSLTILWIAAVIKVILKTKRVNITTSS